MCGIAGAWQIRQETRPVADIVGPMLAALRHRGPDRSQVWTLDGVGLGSTRLAIVGGEAASQPDVSGETVLAFNGEIFNYRELRAALPPPQNGWRTSGDTEVLHRLLQVEGVSGLDDVEGQFALAWWSSSARRLVLARDRDGILPLYYTAGPHGPRFCSEVWSLVGTSLDPRGLALDPSVATAILWGTPPETSVFDGIEQVPAGGYITFDHDNGSRRSVWAPYRPPPTNGGSPTPADLCEVVDHAVRRRIPDDVPWGVMLSGGLDSAVIAAVAGGHGIDSSPLSAYGVQFTDSVQFDERPHQEAVAAALGLDLIPVTVDHRLIAANFEDAVFSAGAPLIRLAPVATQLLSRTAHADGVRVLLSGEGADERFRGYSILRREALATSQPRSARLLGVTTRPGLPPAHATRWMTTAGKIAALLTEPTNGSMLFESVYELYVAPWVDTLDRDELAESGRRARQIEERYFLHSALLASQADRMLMSASVEGRFPFLDGDVAQIANRIPEDELLGEVIEKRLLRAAFETRLPASIVWRPKHPYSAPDTAFWRSQPGFSLLSDLVTPRSVSELGWLSWPAVEWHLRRVRAGAQMSVFDELATAWMASCMVLNERTSDALAA